MMLTPDQRHLTGPAVDQGFRAVMVTEKDGRVKPDDGQPFFSFPGVVVFTSGSTGAPKPVYKSAKSMVLSARATAALQCVPRGAGVIGALPLATNYGFLSCLALATVVGGFLGLLERFDHRSVIEFFAAGEYHFFSSTPFIADILSRCHLEGPPPAPPPVVISSAGQLPPAVFRAFKERFGAGLRVTYGSTEGNLVCAVGPDDPEGPDTVGRAVPGVEVRIGDDPRRPLPPGRSGRIWYSSPLYMAGYGFPGALEPREEIDGWFPTSDLGVLDAAGVLTLLGRSDDCFKTPAGHLVNPAEVASALRRHPAVVDAAVVPVNGVMGAAIGVLVEAMVELDSASLRRHAARLLPSFAQPQLIMSVPALPRMASGKIDRAACIKILEERPSAS
jgi:acyl-CoA synthetase (AMP-forming)/AMP-acid ligase II